MTQNKRITGKQIMSAWADVKRTDDNTEVYIKHLEDKISILEMHTDEMSDLIGVDPRD